LQIKIDFVSSSAGKRELKLQRFAGVVKYTSPRSWYLLTVQFPIGSTLIDVTEYSPSTSLGLNVYSSTWT
jgi:hypothetical protein